MKWHDMTWKFMTFHDNTWQYITIQYHMKIQDNWWQYKTIHYNSWQHKTINDNTLQYSVTWQYCPQTPPVGPRMVGPVSSPSSTTGWREYLPLNYFPFKYFPFKYVPFNYFPFKYFGLLLILPFQVYYLFSILLSAVKNCHWYFSNHSDIS